MSENTIAQTYSAAAWIHENWILILAVWLIVAVAIGVAPVDALAMAERSGG